MKMNGARILVEELINQGVETIFGYPGGAVLNIYDELYKASDRIDHIITAHEQGAAHAADGYARASGKVGVVLATSGPGATNLVTGIANAYLDSVPMVAITGNVSVTALGRDSFQEVDIIGVTEPVVKHSFMVRDVSELEGIIKEAFRIASTGRKGPVLIDIPKNVQIGEFEYPCADASFLGQQEIAEDETDASTDSSISDETSKSIDELVELMKTCEKPFIYCGGGVSAASAEDSLRALSEKLDAPVGLSMMGRTALPDSYELNLGMCGMHGNYASSKAQSECDLMIGIGVRFSDRATGDLSEYTKKCKVVHIDIDRAEFSKNVTADLTVRGDIKNILPEIIKRMPEVKHEAWVSEVMEYKKQDNPPRDNSFTPRNIIEAVREHTSDDTVVATDVGQHQMWTIQYYRFEQPHTLMTSGGFGTMGYGLGAAIGACVARGRKRTVLFTSDGSFGMNLNEMCTVVTQNLPITIVVLNNDVLGMVRQWQTIFYGERYSQTTLNRKTKFAELADAFGSHGYSVKDMESLKKVLSEIDTGDTGSYLIDCHISKDEKVYPMIPPGHSIKDIIMKG